MFLSAKPAAQTFLAAGFAFGIDLSHPSQIVHRLRITNVHAENSTVYMRRCTKQHPDHISNVALAFGPLSVHVGQVSNVTVNLRGLATTASYLLKTEVSLDSQSPDTTLFSHISSIYLDTLDLSLRGSPHLDPLSRKFAYTCHDSESDAFREEELFANVRISLNFSDLSFIPHQLHVSLFDASAALEHQHGPGKKNGNCENICKTMMPYMCGQEVFGHPIVLTSLVC
jgi:hypothetical protein